MQKARKAIAEQRYDEARVHLQQVLERSDSFDDRIEAMYYAGVIDLRRSGDFTETDRSKGYLAEVATGGGGFDRRNEAQLFLSLLDALHASRKQARAIAAKAAQLRDQALADRERLESGQEEEQATLQQRIVSLEAEVAAHLDATQAKNERIVELEAELKRKEEALQKVTKALVGGNN